MTSDGEAAAKTGHIDSNLICQATLLVARPPTSRRYLSRCESKGGRAGISALSRRAVRACTGFDDGMPHLQFEAPGAEALLQARDAPAQGAAGQVSL